MKNKLLTAATIIFYLMIISVLGMGYELFNSSINNIQFKGYFIASFVVLLAIWVFLLSIIAKMDKRDNNE